MTGAGKPEERVVLEVGEKVLEALLAAKIRGLRLKVREEAPEILVSLGIGKAGLRIEGVDGRGRLVLAPQGAAGFAARMLGGRVSAGNVLSVEGGKILVSLLPPGLPVRLAPLEAVALEGRIRLVSILST